MKNLNISSNSKSQKKLISFKNSDLVNYLISLEANANNTNDSAVVENTIFEHFLPEDSFVAELVARNISNENGIVETMLAINQLCIDNPGLINDSYLELLVFLKNQLVRFEITYDSVTPALELLKERTKNILSIISETIDADPYYQYFIRDENTIRSFHKSDTLGFRDISKLGENEFILKENIAYLAFLDIIKFWDFRDSTNNSKLKHSKSLYLLLDAALRICNLPDLPDIKYEFLQKIRNLNFEKNPKPIFHSSEFRLTKRIQIKGKCFKTTEDVIVLKSNPNAIDTEFTSAYRVINGPGAQKTSHPFVILFQNESDDERQKITENLAKNYPSEFPIPENVYYVPLLWEYEYFDERFCWITI